MALTEQEQKDLDVLQNHNFGFKFARQLNAMSTNQHERLEAYSVDKESLESDLGKAQFKEEVKKFKNQPETTKYLDENGDELVNADGEPDPQSCDPIYPTTAELDAFATEEYDAMLARFDDKIAFATETIRLLSVEQDFRARGIVIREPIGTTYYQSFDGSDSSDGISKANAIKYLNWFTQQARSAGDILVCRRPRGGFNPEDIDYNVDVGNVSVGGASAQGALTNPITANHSSATGTSIKTPGHVVGFEWEENVRSSNTTWNHDNNYMRPEMSRNTDPRDRSWAGYFFNRYYSMAEGYSDKLDPTSDGSAEDPIIIMADYDNHWGDFIECAVGSAGDDALNGASPANDAKGGGYVVEFGSKIIRRTYEGTSGGQKIPVHSFITPGDWIFIGELTGGGTYPKPNIAPNVGDDPYEYSYMVRDVNYDKIVLWHPYKGEMTGEYRKVVSMGYAPRWRSMGYSAHGDDTNHSANDTYGWDVSSCVHWCFQGISWYHGLHQHTTANHTERRRLMYFRGDCNMSFKDCQFIGSQRHDENAGWYNRTNWLWYITGGSNYLKADKCLFLNTKVGIYEYYSANQSSHNRPNYFDIKDSIFNGWYWDRTMGASCEYDAGSIEANYNGVNNQYDKPMSRTPMAGIVSESGDSKWDILDCEFVNHGHCHIWNSNNTGMKIRNPVFLGAGMDFVDPTVNTIFEAHENLGVRWARPAFAGSVSAYTSTAQETTSMGNPESGMNSVLNVGTNTLPGGSAVTTTMTNIVGSHDCKRIVADTGLWHATADNYGRKFYDYMNYNIPDGAYGGYQDVDDNANDFRSYGDNYVGLESGNTTASGGASTAIGTRDTFRMIGSSGNTSGGITKYSNWYTGHRRNSLGFNRWDNSTHRYRYTNYFGSCALYGAKNVTHTGANAGKLHLEDGTEKWNSWWCSDPDAPWGHASPKPYSDDENKCIKYVTNTTSGTKIPKGQPQAEELFMEYHWWPMRTNNGAWTQADTDWGAHNQYNNTTYNDQGRHYRFGNSYREYSHIPVTNISVDATDEWGKEEGNGPGHGIGMSPFYGPVMSYYPHYYAYNGTWNWAGIESDHENLAVQDYFHLYMNYDKDNLGRSGDTYPEVFHPMIKGSRKGESAGISKNIIFNTGNKTHPWANEDNTTPQNNDIYTRAVAKPRIPIMETVGQAYDDAGALGTILRSGGGSYVVKVFPTTRGFGQWSEPVTENNTASSGDSKQYGRWDDRQALKIFEYPFYLSTNARTYTVYLNRGIRTAGQYAWGADPTADECFLEMEYFASKTTGDRYMTHGVRRKDRSTSGLTFSSGSGGWEALAVTVTPETEGVGYLRLWWKKEKESGKSNTFYVDPKVEVT